MSDLKQQLKIRYQGNWPAKVGELGEEAKQVHDYLMDELKALRIIDEEELRVASFAMAGAIRVMEDRYVAKFREFKDIIHNLTKKNIELERIINANPK